jgi:hypothetical protein
MSSPTMSAATAPPSQRTLPVRSHENRHSMHAVMSVTKKMYMRAVCESRISVGRKATAALNASAHIGRKKRRARK